MNISQYKSKIASRYIPTDPEQIGLKIMEAEYYFTSIKYDGYFVALEIKNGKAVLFDRNGNPKEIKAITTAAKTIEVDIMLAGELCVFENGKSTGAGDGIVPEYAGTDVGIAGAYFELVGGLYAIL
jgi:hypothetical protein